MKNQFMIDAEKRVKAFLANRGTERCTAKQVTEKCGISNSVLYKLDSWKEYRRGIETPRKRIAMVLKELSEEGVTRPTRKQVAKRAECSMATVVQAPAWINRSQLYPHFTLPLEKRIKNAMQELISEGKTKLFIRDVAKKAECSESSVSLSTAWGKYRARLETSTKKLRKRVEKTIKDLSATGKKRLRVKEVMQKANCTSNEVLASPAWKQLQQLQKGTAEERIVAALNEIKATGKTYATMKEVMEISGCCSASLVRSPAWKQHRQSQKKQFELIVEKTIQEILAMGKTKPRLKDVSEKVNCSISAVHMSSAWQKYRQSLQSG